MKIAISTSGKDNDSLLDVRFGRSEYFQIHDTESGEVKIIENKGKLSSAGAGIAASQQLIDEKTDIIITGYLGPNAFELIEKTKIKAYKCGSIPINTVLKKYNDGELDELNLAGPAHHGN